MSQGSSPEPPTASIVLVRLLVDAIERAGISRDELIGGRFDPNRLAEGSVRVDLSQYDILQARAIELTGDEALWMHISEQASDASFDLISPLVTYASSLREGIALCSQFVRLLKDEGSLTLQERGDVATLRFDFVRRSPLFDRPLAEFAVCGLLRLLRGFGGPRVMALAASFEHARPKHHGEYARIFGGVERFGQKFTGLSFPGSLLDRPHLHGHGELVAVLRLEAEREMSRIARGLDDVERLRQYLLVQRPSCLPGMQTAARDMGVSPRSLRRKLALKGVSYRAITQSVRETLAAQMLADPKRTIQEVAHALGFSDASAFHRAFKKWKGSTPGVFKKVRAV
ncbi:MAG: AraC family transcriptional regulator [Polyangiaceae bacterium]